MSNANRDYAIVYDVKNSSLVLSRPLNFYITDKNTSNIFVKLVTKVIAGNGIDQYTDIENASNYVLTMRVIKPNNEVKSLEATQHEPENIVQFDLTEDFKDIPGKYICELTISTIVSGRQELITSDPFNYEVKRSILSNVGEIIETEDTTVEKLLNNLDATKTELSSQIKEIENILQSKEFNILEFGGKADGAFDNADIIQNIINDNIDKKVTIILPLGEFFIGKTIQLKSNTTIRGVGQHSTILKTKSDTMYPVFLFRPTAGETVENVELLDFSIDATNKVDGPGHSNLITCYSKGNLKNITIDNRNKN